MKTDHSTFAVRPIGVIHSILKSVAEAPRQGSEGAPDAWLEIDAAYLTALAGVETGDELLIITWLHLADRSILQVHPRDDISIALAGVFATRSSDRPNPLGLHRLTVREMAGARLQIGPIEAVDGTPVIDIKPVLDNHDR